MAVSPEVLRNHFAYSEWASLRLLQTAGQLSPAELTHDFRTSDRTILDTLVHIFAADRVWLDRVQGAAPAVFVSDADRSLAALQAAWPPLLERWKEWAAGLTYEQAATTVTYQDLKGNQWQQPLWQVVLHVVNHATHHRGQVSGFLRSLGHTPPPLDLVHYFRQL